jgi:hypothetical protein
MVDDENYDFKLLYTNIQIEKPQRKEPLGITTQMRG